MSRIRSAAGKLDRFHYFASLTALLAVIAFVFALLQFNLGVAALAASIATLTFLVVLADRRMRIGFMRQNETIVAQNAILTEVLEETQELGQSGLLPAVLGVQTGLVGLRGEIRTLRAELRDITPAAGRPGSGTGLPLVVSVSEPTEY